MGRKRKRNRGRAHQFVPNSYSQRRSRTPTRPSCSPRRSRTPTRSSCSPRRSRTPTRRSCSPRRSRTPTRRSRSPRRSRTPTRPSCSPRRRTPIRRSRSRSHSPRWRRRSYSRSCSPWQHITALRHRSPRSRWRSSRKMSRSRSCPLLCFSQKLYEPHRRDSSCRNSSSKRIGPRYGSLSPNRFKMMKYSRRSRSSSRNTYSSRQLSPTYSVSPCSNYSDSPGVLSSRSVSRSCSRSRSPESLSYITSTQRKNRSRSRSPRTSRSRSRSPRRSRSRSRSPRLSRSRSRSRRRSRSGSISPRRSRSGSISPRRSRSGSISPRRSRSGSISPRRRSNTKRRRFRGRGRTRRTRPGRSRSRSRSVTPHRRSHSKSRSPHKSKTNATVVDIDQNVSEFFFANASTEEHIQAQKQNRSRYIACMSLLHLKGVELRQQVRVRALAASWARNDFKMSTELLCDRDRYGMVEILKALQIMDSGRLIRQGEKTLKRLQMARGKVSRHKIDKLKCKINSMRKLQPKKGSASGSICKNVRKWTKTLSKEELERYALHLPKKPWKKLADICHFNPEEDFPNLPWFLSYCFGKSAPCGTVVHTCEDLNEKNINDKLKTCDIPYAHSRKFKKYLNVESKIKIATSEPRLDTVLWYYEDIECRQVDEIIMQRLDTGDTSDLSIGKLMDRLITLKELARGFRCGRRTTGKYKIPFMKTLLSLAESKLQNVKLKLDSPVVVLGDRSASMDIAVRTSSVITGILCSICSADLVVFNHNCKRPKKVPANVDEALKLAMKTEATGSTNPSSALMPFYKQKRVVKTFIIVTDEEENVGNFADLFEKYHNEVFPARLVFVSFLDQHEKGYMCTQLRNKGFNPLQFVLDARRPDLTKLEKLFGILASESKSFTEELSILQSKLTGHIHDGDL